MNWALSRGGSIAAIALVGTAGAASAQVAWSNPAGAGSFFTWANGESGLGLFGNPTLFGGNTFIFTPPAFTAASTNGTAGVVTDQVKVRLTANPGQRFTQIRVSELGNWSITGIGSVQASGTLFLTDLNAFRAPAVQNITPNPAMPISTAGSGGWSGTSVIDLASIPGPDWTSLQLVFTNTVQANTGASSNASIQKTQVKIEVLPAPGALAILGLGGLIMARRRR